jgi:hypothetical protein
MLHNKRLVENTYGSSRRDTFNVCAGGEEAAFACEDGEDCVGVVVEVAEGGDGGGD